MASKNTIKTAAQLLDRFFRDGEGRTNRQIDVYFALEDMDVSSEKAEPALEYLKSRGLFNLFGSDIGFLTDKGVKAVVEELDISKMDKEVRDFIQKPVAAPAPEESAPDAAPAPTRSQGSERPDRAQLTHIDLEGGEFTLTLGMRCRVGRADDNEVRINDKRASKHHAEVIYSNGRYVLVDLESANGTLLNGEYAVEPIPLKHDDEVVIGRTMLLYQAPKVVPAPDPDPVEAPAEPGTVVNAAHAQGPTERPAPARDQTPSIRVVKGTPAAPPTAERPVPVAPSTAAGPDLFAEPPTQAPAGDLFSQTPPTTPAPGSDLFADEPPTQVPPEPSPPGKDDLFGEPPTVAASDDDLFSSPPSGAPAAPAAPTGDDLFGAGPASTQGGDDLFSEPASPSATPGGLAPMDPSGGLELDPIAAAPELSQIPAPAPSEPLEMPDTVAAAPAHTPAPDLEATADRPSVDDLWAGEDTPASAAPELLQNAPVQLGDGPTLDTPPPNGGDAATLMMDRDALAEVAEAAEAEAAAVEAELPRWSDTPESDGSSPPFAAPDDVLDAATEALGGEELPEATPSLAMQAIEASSAETMDATPAHPEFFDLLRRLKVEVKSASVPEQQALIEAIEVLEDHPYVRLALGKI